MKCCNGNCNQGRSCQNRKAEDLGLWQGVAFLVAILLLLGLVGQMDYEDAKLHQDHYCKMVAEGAWPDYDEVYTTECVALGYPTRPAR